MSDLRFFLAALFSFGLMPIYGVQIMYLNGPSSVGKTTLARVLQDKLEEPFLVVGIDHLMGMMPEKLNSWPEDASSLDGSFAEGFGWQPVTYKNGVVDTYRIDAGPFGKQIMHAFKDVVVALVQSGHNIIVDDVSLTQEEVDAWRDALAAFDVLWVGLSAPVEVLEEREQKRGDRKTGLSRWQIDLVHNGVAYDLMIDTHSCTLDENVKIIQRYIGRNS